MTRRRGAITWLAGVGVASVLAGCGSGSPDAGGTDANCGFVNRPVDLVVPWGAGGGADTFARTIGEQAEGIVDQSIVIQNLQGASGEVGMSRFMAMGNDGLSLVQLSSDFVLLNAAGQSQTDFKDLHFLVRGQYAPSFLYVPTDSEFETAQDLVDAARANPGEISIAGSGAGSPDDVAVRSMREAGIDLNYVAYNEAGERYVAPLQGSVDALFEQTGDIQSFLDAGDYRPLLSFTEERVDGEDDVPAIAELDVEVTPTQWRGLAIRDDVSEEVKSCWEDVLAQSVETEDYQSFTEQTKSDFEPPILGEEMNSWVQGEYDRAVELFGN